MPLGSLEEANRLFEAEIAHGPVELAVDKEVVEGVFALGARGLLSERGPLEDAIDAVEVLAPLDVRDVGWLGRAEANGTSHPVVL